MPAERLTPAQMERYQGHLALPDLGPAGQARLLRARVLIIGAGGLGCPVAQYLVAAGVGTVGLVDDDTVDSTNLQRQVLYVEADVGRPKVEAAAERLRAMNGDVDVQPIGRRVTAANVRSLVAGRDLVVDGSDNFATRYVVNDACVLEGVPLVSGSLYRYEGQAMVVIPGEGPCYRCVFPSPPPEQGACREAGILGPVAGLVGSLQAAEAVRLLAAGGDGAASGLAGRLLLVDVRTMEFRSLQLSRDAACPLCGENPSIAEPTAVAVCGSR